MQDNYLYQTYKMSDMTAGLTTFCCSTVDKRELNPDIRSDMKNSKRWKESNPFTDDMFITYRGLCGWPAVDCEKIRHSRSWTILRAGATTVIHPGNSSNNSQLLRRTLHGRVFARRMDNMAEGSTGVTMPYACFKAVWWHTWPTIMCTPSTSTSMKYCKRHRAN